MEVNDNIVLDRGLAMSPSMKRAQEESLEAGGRKGRKLKYLVIGKDWGEQVEGAEDMSKDDFMNKD